MKRRFSGRGRPAPMDYDPMNRGRRRGRHAQDLGPDARCVRCGTTNPEHLMKVGRSIFERHHPHGEAHEPGVTVVVCRNCHAELSAAQQDDGVPLTPQSTILESLLAVTTATGSFLRLTGETLLAWGERGKDVVNGLDRDFKDWRKRPWA